MSSVSLNVGKVVGCLEEKEEAYRLTWTSRPKSVIPKSIAARPQEKTGDGCPRRRGGDREGNLRFKGLEGGLGFGVVLGLRECRCMMMMCWCVYSEIYYEQKLGNHSVRQARTNGSIHPFTSSSWSRGAVNEATGHGARARETPPADPGLFGLTRQSTRKR